MTNQKGPAKGEPDAAATPRTVQGWTIVHSKRQLMPNGEFVGVWLGARENGAWIAGRMLNGKSLGDGFGPDGEYWHADHFEGGANSTHLMDEALKAYIKRAEQASVWDRMFEQDAGQAIDRYLAGPEVPGAAKLSAGWSQTSVQAPLIPAASTTIALPLHKAKYHLLDMLRRTERSAMAHLTVGITLDRHQAVELVRQATGPIRFEYGYNTYWLAAEVN